MAITRCTLLFNFQTTDANKAAQRTAGWSESYYFPTADLIFALGKLNALASVRSSLVATGGAVIGQRVQVVDPVGPSKTGDTAFAGGAGLAADIPQMALYCRAVSGATNNARELVLRGIPDARVQNGSFVSSTDYDRRLQRFFAELRSGWVMRGRDMSQPRKPIVTIDTNGLVTTTIDHAYAVGNRVQIIRTTMPNDRQVGGVYTVLTTPSARTFSIAPGFTLPTRGGSTRLSAIVTPQYDEIKAVRIGTRKVGRVFFPYRGRATVKH